MRIIHDNPPISTNTSTKIAFGERHTHRHRTLQPFLPAGKLPPNVPRVIVAPTWAKPCNTLPRRIPQRLQHHEVGKHATICHNRVVVLRYNNMSSLNPSPLATSIHSYVGIILHTSIKWEASLQTVELWPNSINVFNLNVWESSKLQPTTNANAPTIPMEKTESSSTCISEASTSCWSVVSVGSSWN